MPIELTQLSLSSLEQLDGRIEALFQKHLAFLSSDCMNRPGDKTPRKLSLELSIVPQTDPATGECDDVFVSIEAKSKVPTYKTKEYPLRVSRGGLLFNADIPDAIDQTSIKFPTEKDEDE